MTTADVQAILLHALQIEARVTEAAECYRTGDSSGGELRLSVARNYAKAIAALCEMRPEAKPLRRLALVSAAREDDGLAPWMHDKKDGPNGAA